MKYHSKCSFTYILLIIFYFPINTQAQEFLIPKTALVQHAGSIGYFSAGVGYNLFRNNNGSLDIVWGFVPKSKGGSQHIYSSKFAYRPLNFKIRDLGTIHALNPGLFIAYYSKDAFHNKAEYPKGYYWWPSAFRLHLSLSNELKFHTPESLSASGIKYFSLYSELNTNDLYMVSWAINREQMPLKKIIKLGFGIKAYF